MSNAIVIDRCTAGCVGELAAMGRWAPYRLCPTCGTGVTMFYPSHDHWKRGGQPSAEQEEFWAGRDEQREAILGSEPGRLADIGCGFGHFILWARSRGWDAWGTDGDAWARERSVAPERVVPTIGDLEGPFDLITLWDVLEHVPEPVAFLAELRDLLRPGGRMLVSSPNFLAIKLRWEWLRLRPNRFAALVRPHEHVSQFSEQGLRLVFERSGYRGFFLHNPPLASHRNVVVNRVAQRFPAVRVGMFAEGTRD